MAIRVALQHKTMYRFDRSVILSPHEVRLRPAAHARTPILTYSLTVAPEKHFINWQQDPYGNYIARFVFPEPSDQLTFTVDLIADMTVINPFDFFVEKYAEQFPFTYPEQLRSELAAYLQTDPPAPLQSAWIASARAALVPAPVPIANFLVSINQRLQQEIAYLLRMEPGVQTPEFTLAQRSGSCRDTAWLLVLMLRQMGLAARFVSGYLIQLVADVKSLDGPSGTGIDFTDLHAWVEVYVPGAGWVGLDPTSGMLAGEGHIPLACTATPSSAAPISGFTEPAKVAFTHDMTVTRILEDPRVTKPYSDAEWARIDLLGQQVDSDLLKQDVRLTQGGEPTFVSVDDMEAAEWNTSAHGETKRVLAGQLAIRLKRHFAPGGLQHYGQGKWYPGEALPRWALNICWRADGVPVWRNPALFADEDCKDGYGDADARRFASCLTRALGLPIDALIPAYEDVRTVVQFEEALPSNLDPLQAELGTSPERRRLARLLAQGLGKIVGYVLPIKPATALSAEQDAEAPAVAGQALSAVPIDAGMPARWRTSSWPLKRGHLYLVGGDSPLGLRLPLDTLPWVLPGEVEPEFDVDPFAAVGELASSDTMPDDTTPAIARLAKTPAPRDVIHTALAFEVRAGRLHVFMPPLKRISDYLSLVAVVESTAETLAMRLWLEGYPPPRDARIKVLSVTPDPGVIEVNIHPASSWAELSANVTTLYEEARQARLGTEKFMLDGRHTGTGGGNHATLGGITAADSPMLRRPDLLKSLITYWQNHPALSYLFSGTFVGPTSQAPRVDEARDDNLYELAIAFQQMSHALPAMEESKRPWLVDRLLRNLLVDLTGNTHRSEFSIDKLYSPDGPTGRLGLVELRAFEMPPHARMSLVQMLLLRALVARFWRTPYGGRLIPWGTQLHDRWMLPHFVAADMHDIVQDLRSAGYAFEQSWFAPFIEFRFPRYGNVVYQGVEMELRQAIEPWNVLGEEASAGGTARYVDSSVERLQLRVIGLTDSRHMVTCNGRRLPLHPTGTAGEYVAGVRFRAWAPWSGLHPSIGVQAPLRFDLIDTWNNRSIGGCMYHVVHPGGRNYDSFPVNANEAEARRFARFVAHGHTAGLAVAGEATRNPAFPFTLDLRWQPD